MLRWVARIVGVVVVGFWLSMGVCSFFTEPEPLTWEGVVIVGLTLVGLLGVIIGWRKPGRGAVLLLIVAALHSVFALAVAGRYHLLAALFGGGPYWVSGGLFLWSARRTSTRPHPESPPSLEHPG